MPLYQKQTNYEHILERSYNMAFLFWNGNRIETPQCSSCGSSFTTEDQACVSEDRKIRKIYIKCMDCGVNNYHGTFKHLGGHNFAAVDTDTFSYTLFNFLMIGEAVTDTTYPNEEYFEYIQHFEQIKFNVHEKVESLSIQLDKPSANRNCFIYCFGETIDELNSYPEGQMPESVGMLKLTLWRDRAPELQSFF